MDRAKELANQMADHALSHSRKAFKVYGGRDALVKQFEPYAEIIADLESAVERNQQNIERTETFLNRSELLMANATVPDFPPRDWG